MNLKHITVQQRSFLAEVIGFTCNLLKMSLQYKAYLYEDRVNKPKEIRRFTVDEGVSSSYEYLRRKVGCVQSLIWQTRSLVSLFDLLPKEEKCHFVNHIFGNCGVLYRVSRQQSHIFYEPQNFKNVS